MHEEGNRVILNVYKMLQDVCTHKSNPKIISKWI